MSQGLSEEELKVLIYEKEMECPLCKGKIIKKCVKGSRNRLIRTDVDLCPHYHKVNPLFYEVIVCEYCGFAQLNKKDEMPTPAEGELICKNVCMNFTQRHYHTFYTAEEAVERYKLALVNAIARNGTMGERAYILLKIAWVYREMEKQEEEIDHLIKARKAFMIAYQSEEFPIFELQEVVVTYLVAAISYEIGEYKEAKKWLSPLMMNKKLEVKLKDRCLVLKDMINKKISEENQKKNI